MTTMALDRQAPVFLCHARPDLPLVRALAAYLRAFGLRAWLDVEDLGERADWKPAIAAVIEEAALCIACISTHSARSQWTSYELDLALKQRVRVAPVFLDGHAHDAAPTCIRGMPAIDVSHTTGDEAAFEAARRIAAPVRPLGLDFAARAIHERWRSALREAGRRSRWRPMTAADHAWLNGAPGASGNGEMDIMQFSGAQLPPSLASEARSAAADAAAILREMPTAGIDAMARAVHAGWVARNRATRSLPPRYEDLPEEEREKDRIVIRTTALALGLAAPR